MKTGVSLLGNFGDTWSTLAQVNVPDSEIHEDFESCFKSNLSSNDIIIKQKDLPSLYTSHHLYVLLFVLQLRSCWISTLLEEFVHGLMLYRSPKFQNYRGGEIECVIHGLHGQV